MVRLKTSKFCICFTPKEMAINLILQTNMDNSLQITLSCSKVVNQLKNFKSFLRQNRRKKLSCNRIIYLLANGKVIDSTLTMMPKDFQKKLKLKKLKKFRKIKITFHQIQQLVMKDNTKSISTTMVDLGMPILLKLI